MPSGCPCPKETYCDLATGTCKVGCADDSHCGAGRKCDPAARRCRSSCQRDAECAAGQICDEEMMLCRAGCRGNGDCTGPAETCDPQTYTCKGASACMWSTECALGQFCDPETRRCISGCRHDKLRCPEGQACVAQPDGSSRCQVECMGAECNGDRFTCYYPGSDQASGMCRKRCINSMECRMGERCTEFALDPRLPWLTPIMLCAKTCDVAGCIERGRPARQDGALQLRRHSEDLHTCRRRRGLLPDPALLRTVTERLSPQPAARQRSMSRT